MKRRVSLVLYGVGSQHGNESIWKRERQDFRWSGEDAALTQEFESMEHFKQELIEYLDYYNNRRIKAKRKGLPPAIHR